jgi:RNA-directed DNA polymerase
VLYSLHHVIDMDWMREAYRLTRKDGAAGIDGVTAAAYEVQLEANLRDLLDRILSGRYQAPPVRRAYIPKADGSQRPLGIPTFEDKVAQRAIAMVLEAIYEQDYLPCAAPSGASDCIGSWTSTYASTSTPCPTATCAPSSTDESRMV